MSDGMSAVVEALRSADSVAVCCHVNPDGDTIGSALALRLALLRLGKRVAVFSADKRPDMLAGLPGADAIRNYDSLGTEESFALLLPVDVSDSHRMGRLTDGDVFALMQARCARSAQIDHHGTNPGYCQCNDVDGDAPAAAVLVWRLLPSLGVRLDADLAACLYAALSTDTGNFSHGNTNAEAFRMAAELMDAGLELSRWNRRLFLEKPLAQQLLIARAMASLRYLCGGRLAVMRLSRQDFEDCGALKEHADTIVNIGLEAQGARMSLLAREDGDGIKMSLRAVAPLAVDGVARSFGGGGHAQAAGCTVRGSLEEACAQVAEAMAVLLAQAEQGSGDPTSAG